MRKIFRRSLLSLLFIVVCMLFGCGGAPTESFTITAGSESKTIADLIIDFGKKKGYQVHMQYLGSVDQKRLLELRPESELPDAIMPASSLWLRLGDKRRLVSDEAAIMRTPVIFGVKMSKAKELGWYGRDDVSIAKDILPAIAGGLFRFAMTSATQSNSGASAYLGFLTALTGKQTALTSEDLENPELQKKTKQLLSGQNRSSGSSGWLAHSFPELYDQLDGLVNYEAMIIKINNTLVKQGREPLYAVYPVDGLALADPTLGFINKADNKQKKAFFLELRDYLLQDDTQKKIAERGFRTSKIGSTMANADPDVYRKDWGINTTAELSFISLPTGQVIDQALQLYQQVFRKPSYTVFLVDVSGSMRDKGLPEAKDALLGLLDQNRAAEYYLQATPQDTVRIIPFNSVVLGDGVKVTGPEEFAKAIAYVKNLRAGGGTNIYAPVVRALDLMQADEEQVNDSLPAIVLLTDGLSKGGDLPQVEQRLSKLQGIANPPIFSIMFGAADPDQLKGLAHLNTGRVFDSKKGLAEAFRKVSGYN